MTDSTDALRAQLADELRRVRAVRELLEARVRVRQRRTSDDEMAALLALIQQHVRPPFHVEDVLNADDPTLRDTLVTHRLDTARRLGAFFRDVHRRAVGAFRARQCARDRYGWTWTIERA